MIVRPSYSGFFLAAAATIVALFVGPRIASATYPGVNGLVAYTDLLAAGSPLERRAVFIHRQGQFTHPVARGGGQSDDDSSPAWSPDGGFLAFVRHDGESNESAIFVVRPDGTDQRRVFGTDQLQNGQPGPLSHKSIKIVGWHPNGRDILFSGDGMRWRVEGADIGIDLPVLAGTPHPPFQYDYDVGGEGVLGNCPLLSIHPICIYSLNFTTARGLDIDLPGEPVALGLTAQFKWWPKANQRRLAFVGDYAENGVLRRDLFAAAFENNGLPSQQVSKLTDSPLVSCVNTVNGVTTVTTAPQYKYFEPVPSPDARYILVQRRETIPTYDDQDHCSLIENAEGLFQLRETGALQSLLVTSKYAAEAAWQPAPGQVVIQVSDGHGHPLDDLIVTIRDENTSAIIAGASRNIEGGTYIFDNVSTAPATYRVRVELVEQSGPPAFGIIYDYPGNGGVWAERSITIDPDALQSEYDFPFMDGDGLIKDANPGNTEDPLVWQKLDDMAAIYYQVHRYWTWARQHLTATTGGSVEIHAFTAINPLENEPLKANSGSYVSAGSAGAMLLGTQLSSYEARDGISNGQRPDRAPVNGEWHEFAHHLYFQFIRPGELCLGEENHEGYFNDSTCDSMQEGIAAFLATQLEQDPDYVGIANLESHIKAYGLRFAGLTFGPAGAVIDAGLESTEDLAVAALLWDLADDDSDVMNTMGIGWDRIHFPVTYQDDVNLGLSGLWQVLVDAHPKTVFDLHAALRALPQFSDLDRDLDQNGTLDVNALDLVFLMHGFHPIDADQTVIPGHDSYHHDVVGALFDGDPVGADVGRTDHIELNGSGAVTKPATRRFNFDQQDESRLGVQSVDASGTPLLGAEVDLTIAGPDRTYTVHRKLGAGDDSAIHLELPMPFELLVPFDAPVPDCDPEAPGLVDVTVQGSINGYASSDSPTFDNCTYMQAILGGTQGQPAMSVTLAFPEDSTAPVTTETDFTLGGKLLWGPIIGDYTVEGHWSVELDCDDPVADGFASGCHRIEYGIDGEPFVPYEDEIILSEPGLYALNYRSVDAAGNESAIGSRKLGVLSAYSTTKPVTTVTAVPSVPPVGNGATTGSWSVTLSCLAANAGTRPGAGCQRIEYSLTPTFIPVAYTGPLVFSTPGVYNLHYRSIDVLGNTETIGVTQLIVAGLDSTPPFSWVEYEPAAPSLLNSSLSMGSWTIRLTCDDANFHPPDQISSGCALTEYSLDGAAFQPYVGEFLLDQVGSHTLAFRSIDVAGNQEVGGSIALSVVAASDADSDGFVDFVDNCSLVANPDQTGTDSDYFGNRCDADFNGNGTVDSNDASLLKARLGSSAEIAPDQDLDGDGFVDAADMDILKTLFRQPPGPAFGYTYFEIQNAD